MRYDFTALDYSGKLIEIGSNESNYLDALVDVSKILYNLDLSVIDLKPFYHFTSKSGKVSRRKITADRLAFISHQLSMLRISLG